MPWNPKAACVVYGIPLTLEAGAVDTDVPSRTRRDSPNNTSECRSGQPIAKRNDKDHCCLVLFVQINPNSTWTSITAPPFILTFVLRSVFAPIFSQPVGSLFDQPLRYLSTAASASRHLLLPFSTYSVGLDTSAGR